MDNFEQAISIFALASFLGLAVLANRFASPAVITLSRKPRLQAEDRDLRRVLLSQFRISFWLVVTSGIIALVILVAVFGLIFFGQNEGWGAKIVGLACGLGDSALFGFFFKVWRRAGAVIGLDVSESSNGIANGMAPFSSGDLKTLPPNQSP